MPDGLSFDEIGTVTRVHKEQRNIVVKAVTFNLVLLDRQAAPTP